MKRTVWIEFTEESKLEPITFTNVESLHTTEHFVVVDYLKGEDIQSNYYPYRLVHRIHETYKGIRK